MVSKTIKNRFGWHLKEDENSFILENKDLELLVFSPSNILSIARSLESLPRALQILNTNLKIGAISKPLGEQIQNKISPTKR